MESAFFRSRQGWGCLIGMAGLGFAGAETAAAEPPAVDRQAAIRTLMETSKSMENIAFREVAEPPWQCGQKPPPDQ